MAEQENQPQNLPTGGQPGEWERDLVNRLAFASLNEQRRRRYWWIGFKILGLIWLFGLLFVLAQFGSKEEDGLESVAHGPHTAMVRIDGVIAESTQANAENIMRGLRDAFEASGTRGVILRINSPGGSPVQAGEIYEEIQRLRKLHPKIPVYAVVSDICASGGYYIASAADRIYADKASIVGSIGVIMNGFGFVDTMKKLGVERRLYTAGAHKGFLDPFSASKPDEVAHIQKMLDDIHQQFIDAVKQGRGDRLHGDDKTLFSGLVWTGQEGIKLGLVDALGSADSVARDVIHASRIVDYTPKQKLLERFAERLGATLSHTALNTLGVGGGQVREQLP